MKTAFTLGLSLLFSTIIAQADLREMAASHILNYDKKFGNKSATLFYHYYNRGTNQLELSGQENAFLKKRKKITDLAMDRLLGTSPSYWTSYWHKRPRIALCFSGGGFRATLSSLGFSQGLHEKGILDATTYAAGLSGSTWFLFPWLAKSGSSEQLVEFRNFLVRALAKEQPQTKQSGGGLWSRLGNRVPGLLLQEVWTSESDIEFDAWHLAQRKGIAPGFIDYFSLFLARTLLEGKYSLPLSSLAENADLAKMPLPIGTAIEEDDADYYWYEFTPYDVGKVEAKNTFDGPARIPTWSLGRKFEKQSILWGYSSVRDNFGFLSRQLGEESYYSIEPSLAYLLATFGSAFSVRVGEAANMHWALSLASNYTNPKYQLFEGGKVKNFYDPSRRDELHLRDAGLHFNLPIPPLLRPEREINVLIVLDSSGDLPNGKNSNKDTDYYSAWEYFSTYAKKYDLKIPEILKDEGTIRKRLTQARVKGQSSVVFGDLKDPESLTVVYVPTIQYRHLEGGASATDPMKFDSRMLTYTSSQSEELLEYGRALGRDVSERIIEVLRSK